MLAGFQIADITPPLGVHLAGHFVDRPANEIHDPITARALVLADGNTRAALIGTDLVGIPEQLVAEARALITRQVGIPPENVMIWATHTHAGPKLGDIGWSPKDPRYNTILPRMLAGAVVAAAHNVSEITARFAVGTESRISFNRRYRMRDGTIQTNPGVGNPAVAAVDGPTDPDVGVLLLDRDGRTAGALVNFACHLDVIGSGNHSYSADFPYFMHEALKAVYGPDFHSIFANGACGNLNHINVFATRRQGGFDHSRLMGRILAGEVLKTNFLAEPIQLEPISCTAEKVELQLRRFSAEEIAQFKKDLNDPEVASSRISSGNFARGCAERALAIVESGISSLQVEVQVIRLGELALVAIPGEYFVEFGLQIKQCSPARATFLIELANGSIGYIPTRAAFETGAYEGSSARFNADAGETLAAAALRMLSSTP